MQGDEVPRGSRGQLHFIWCTKAPGMNEMAQHGTFPDGGAGEPTHR